MSINNQGWHTEYEMKENINSPTIVHDEDYSTNASWSLIELYFYVLFNYHWVDTSAIGPLVHEHIILPVVSVSALTMYIVY